MDALPHIKRAGPFGAMNLMAAEAGKVNVGKRQLAKGLYHIAMYECRGTFLSEDFYGFVDGHDTTRFIIHPHDADKGDLVIRHFFQLLKVNDAVLCNGNGSEDKALFL